MCFKWCSFFFSFPVIMQQEFVFPPPDEHLISCCNRPLRKQLMWPSQIWVSDSETILSCAVTPCSLKSHENAPDPECKVVMKIRVEGYFENNSCLVLFEDKQVGFLGCALTHFWPCLCSFEPECQEGKNLLQLKIETLVCFQVNQLCFPTKAKQVVSQG